GVGCEIDLARDVAAAGLESDRLHARGAVAQQGGLIVELRACGSIRIACARLYLAALDHLGIAARLPLEHQNIDFPALQVEPIVAASETIRGLAWVIGLP